MSRLEHRAGEPRTGLGTARFSANRRRGLIQLRPATLGDLLRLDPLFDEFADRRSLRTVPVSPCSRIAFVSATSFLPETARSPCQALAASSNVPPGLLTVATLILFAVVLGCDLRGVEPRNRREETTQAREAAEDGAEAARKRTTAKNDDFVGPCVRCLPVPLIALTAFGRCLGLRAPVCRH